MPNPNVNPADFQPGQEVSAEVARELCRQGVPVEYGLGRARATWARVAQVDACLWNPNYPYRVSPDWAGPPPPRLIPMNEMAEGQVGVIRETSTGANVGAIVMRLLSEPMVVVLQSPPVGDPPRGDFWCNPIPSTVKVQPLNITFDGIDP